MPAVADSSPLIYLAALSDFALLRELFGSVLITPAVYREVVEQGQGFPVKKEIEAALGAWLTVRPVEDQARAEQISTEVRLEAGECEARFWRRSAGLSNFSWMTGARSACAQCRDSRDAYAGDLCRGKASRLDPERAREAGSDEAHGLPAQRRRLPVDPGEGR